MQPSVNPARSSRFAHTPQDLLASFVVFLVALPLCMGVAIASGVPAGLGLITGIVGGLIVGAFAGAPLLVSGPAAGLSVLVWEIVQAHGLANLGTIVLAAGLMQLAFGLVRVGPWFRAISPAVVHGMLAGIGVLIFASQFHVMVDDAPKGSGFKNLITVPQAIWKGLVPLDGSNHHLAALIGVLTIASILIWNSTLGKRFKAIPGALVAVLVGSGAAWAVGLPINYVAVPANIFEGVQWPEMASFARLTDLTVLGTALAVAIIASAETLLSAVAVDQMHNGPRANFDKELIAQGLGNTLCGLLGALPMTGVIVRSAANVEAGARTRLSTILHGAWLMAFVLLLPGLLQMVPVASLAAILVVTGLKLVNVKMIKELRKYGRSEVAIFVITMSAIVATNLLEGILIGLGAVVIKMLWTLSHLEVRIDHETRRTIVHLYGSATFLRLPTLAAALERLAPGSEVHIRFEHLDYIDHACLDLVMNWDKLHRQNGGQIFLEWDDLHGIYRRSRPSGSRLPQLVKS